MTGGPDATPEDALGEAYEAARDVLQRLHATDPSYADLLRMRARVNLASIANDAAARLDGRC